MPNLKTHLTPETLPALGDFLTDFLETLPLFRSQEHPAGPMMASLAQSPSGARCPVVLVLGDNASGKSLLVRWLSEYLSAMFESAEGLQVSMRYRTMGGMHRAFMYGGIGDSEDSTGAVSTVAIQGAFRTAKGRDTPTMVVLDEADMGLSENFGHAYGQLAARHVAQGLGDFCLGLAVITHSREVVRGLLEGLGCEPHVITVGEGAPTLTQWLEGPLQRRTVEELESLQALSMTRYREFDRFFDSLKKRG